MLFCFCRAFTQPGIVVAASAIQKNKTEINRETEVICGVGIEAHVNGKEWTTYLNDSLVLDGTALDSIPAGIYTVYIHFVVDVKGKIGTVSVWKDPGYGLGKRVMDVIARYKGRWHPAEFNGKTVSSYHSQPITFIVEEEECSNPLPAELIL